LTHYPYKSVQAQSKKRDRKFLRKLPSRHELYELLRA